MVTDGMNMRERWHVPAVSLSLDHECADVAAVLALVLASGFQTKPVRDVLRSTLRADENGLRRALLRFGKDCCVQFLEIFRRLVHVVTSPGTIALLQLYYCLDGSIILAMMYIMPHISNHPATTPPTTVKSASCVDRLRACLTANTHIATLHKKRSKPMMAITYVVNGGSDARSGRSACMIKALKIAERICGMKPYPVNSSTRLNEPTPLKKTESA